MLDPDLLEPGIGDPDVSVVDPDYAVSESLWTGRIRFNLFGPVPESRSGSENVFDLFDNFFCHCMPF